MDRGVTSGFGQARTRPWGFGCCRRAETQVGASQAIEQGTPTLGYCAFPFTVPCVLLLQSCRAAPCGTGPSPANPTPCGVPGVCPTGPREAPPPPCPPRWPPPARRLQRRRRSPSGGDRPPCPPPLRPLRAGDGAPAARRAATARRRRPHRAVPPPLPRGAVRVCSGTGAAAAPRRGPRSGAAAAAAGPRGAGPVGRRRGWAPKRAQTPTAGRRARARASPPGGVPRRRPCVAMVFAGLRWAPHPHASWSCARRGGPRAPAVGGGCPRRVGGATRRSPRRARERRRWRRAAAGGADHGPTSRPVGRFGSAAGVRSNRGRRAVAGAIDARRGAPVRRPRAGAPCVVRAHEHGQAAAASPLRRGRSPPCRNVPRRGRQACR